MTGQETTVKQAWRHAEIHEYGLAVKRLTVGFPHGCMIGSIFIFYEYVYVLLYVLFYVLLYDFIYEI